MNQQETLTTRMRICCAHIFGACLGKAHFKSARNTLPKTISVKLHLGTEACPEHEKHQLWDRGFENQAADQVQLQVQAMKFDQIAMAHDWRELIIIIFCLDSKQ